MDQEVLAGSRFMGRAQLDKALNSLLGMVTGIAMDGVITAGEKAFLELWLEGYAEQRHKHPFSELVPLVLTAISEGVLPEEVRLDIAWVCDRMSTSAYFDKTTADMQQLHAILGGIAADGVINETELRGLSAWLQGHEHLKTCWPYDELESLITSVMADKVIDATEHAMLLDFFSEFIAVLDDRTINAPMVQVGSNIRGLCAVCPDISFGGATFCFTGKSSHVTRNQLEALVTARGGKFTDAMSGKVNYLVIGADGNPSWSFACYGRKVEHAVTLRKAGAKVLLVHENDFHDAVADTARGGA